MIEKILFGLSSALALEGLVLAIFPDRIKKIVQLIEKTPASKLALFGLAMMILGFGFLSLIEI